MHEQPEYSLPFLICDRLHLVYTEVVVILVFLLLKKRKSYYIYGSHFLAAKSLKKKKKKIKGSKTCLRW